MTFFHLTEEPRARRAKLVAWLFVLLAGILLVGLACTGNDPEPASGQATRATTTATADSSPTLEASTATARPTQPAETATPTPSDPAPVSGSLEVYFFDVGQGDATLLKGPDFTILIDAGRHDRSDVVPHLRAAGVTSIDLLIGTHPHADHIGQIPQVLSAFPVTEVWLSGDTNNTQIFERVIDAIEASDAGFHQPRAWERQVIGSALIEVVNPQSLTGNLHDGSISVRVVYGSVAFLFTGDAEARTEALIIARGHDLRSQIYQLGHHGSSTSSSELFMRAVQPEVGILVGRG